MKRRVIFPNGVVGYYEVGRPSEPVRWRAQPKRTNRCIECATLISKNATRCLSCSSRRTWSGPVLERRRKKLRIGRYKDAYMRYAEFPPRELPERGAEWDSARVELVEPEPDLEESIGPVYDENGHLYAESVA